MKNKIGKLQVQKIKTSELDQNSIQAMWGLYSSNYNNTTQEKFLADLYKKELVFVGRDSKSKELKGFSTGTIYLHSYNKKSIGIIFSGDTMIHPDYWGQKGLHKAFFKEIILWKLKHPTTPFYWFLICMGYRTYLIFAKNLPEYYPHFKMGLPDWEKGLIHSLCLERFGNNWKSELGVIRSEGSQVTLREDVAPFTEEVLQIPEVHFFTKMNPGYANGDELAMIGKIDLKFFTSVLLKWGKKFIQRKLKSESKNSSPDKRG